MSDEACNDPVCPLMHDGSNRHVADEGEAAALRAIVREQGDAIALDVKEIRTLRSHLETATAENERLRVELEEARADNDALTRQTTSRRALAAALETARKALEQIAYNWHCASDGCRSGINCEHSLARAASRALNARELCGDVPAPKFGGPCTKPKDHEPPCSNGGEWTWSSLRSPSRSSK